MNTRVRDDSDDTTERWQQYRPLLLLCAAGAAAWALVGIWYGDFAGWSLLGEPNEYEQKVGSRQMYWAGGALVVAIAAALVTRRRPSDRRLFLAVPLLLVSAALSLLGWDVRDTAIHPNSGPEIRAFRPPSGAQLVEQDLEDGTTTRIWQSNRPLADVCREMRQEFERWASNARKSTDEYEPCSFYGNRGAFSTFVDVDYATHWHPLVGERALDPNGGEVGIRLVVLAD
jgi:hypothetical protein